MPNPFNQPIIDEFRANDGRVGGMFEGSELILLLTTTGARSGKPHTAPLGFLTDDPEQPNPRGTNNEPDTNDRSDRNDESGLADRTDRARRILVIASAGGAPKDPDWFRNLRADPRVTVETGTRTYEAHATPLTGAERDAAWARAVAGNPGWAEYQATVTRTIPVVALTEV
ncbi:nitroreductase family deazaflavin-dependent oxidoreductase [Actinoplanes bogorensis]|uniref:Nitroreductase family deazaflavin-dependent oxidoreductase n=1 Tax=Paractinoplanes bogorensis TaxID=1610840 RepID=A0ABS5Z0P2_9ACTN|nr:nitroreductase/quinone reductase family protein [Actinoplanes bogorensis]MBU2669218.1 nitroreductase family deazaflavin-dependent oxidoreductase [Actinoplanes bogorensis]